MCSSRQCSNAHATKLTGTKKLPSRISVGTRLMFLVARVTAMHASHSASPMRKIFSQACLLLRATTGLMVWLMPCLRAIGSLRPLVASVVSARGRPHPPCAWVATTSNLGDARARAAGDSGGCDHYRRHRFRPASGAQRGQAVGGRRRHRLGGCPDRGGRRIHRPVDPGHRRAGARGGRKLRHGRHRRLRHLRRGRRAGRHRPAAHAAAWGAPPMAFFTWITGLATVVAVVAPFGQSAPLPSKVFTAIINLIAGVAIISLLSGVARSSVRQLPDGPDGPAGRSGPMGPGPIREPYRESGPLGRRRVPPDGA